MKRSKNLTLTIMAVAIPVALSGCDPVPVTGATAMSVQQCIADKLSSPEQCQAAYDNALKENERVAPRFEDNAECNQQFGNCTAVTENGKTSWIPPMTGFLLGYAVGNLGTNGRTDCNRWPDSSGCAGTGRVVARATPLYRDYNTSEYYTPNNRSVGTGGAVRGSVGTEVAPARAVTISRAGFGSTASARSSFGGGRGGGS